MKQIKRKIVGVNFVKEYKTKNGIDLYLHEIKFFDDNNENIIKGLYSSVTKDQKYFILNQETEFTITEMEGTGGKKNWFRVTPIRSGGYTSYARAVKKEQSRYSGFAMAYAKDLVVANKINIDDMYNIANKMIKWMIEQDKNIEI